MCTKIQVSLSHHGPDFSFFLFLSCYPSTRIWAYVMYMSAPELALAQCWHWVAQCWNWDVHNPILAPCQYGAPRTGTGCKTEVECHNRVPSAGTGCPVLELVDNVVTPNWHPPHIGTSASMWRPILALVPEWGHVICVPFRHCCHCICA